MARVVVHCHALDNAVSNSLRHRQLYPTFHDSLCIHGLRSQEYAMGPWLLKDEQLIWYRRRLNVCLPARGSLPRFGIPSSHLRTIPVWIFASIQNQSKKLLNSEIPSVSGFPSSWKLLAEPPPDNYLWRPSLDVLSYFRQCRGATEGCLITRIHSWWRKIALCCITIMSTRGVNAQDGAGGLATVI